MEYSRHGGSNGMKVGIPRALLYHHYGECWFSFLETLGLEPVVSKPTTTDILNKGVGKADNETCLPVKVFIQVVIVVYA